MRPDRRGPTGEVRVVAPEEIFFSMTDRRGVITAANAVFWRLSGFGADELLGAPHNLIRHPDMPAGVFHLMWEALRAGRPFAGYVRNLAADGATYDMFATVTPVRDGYLSVRSAASAAESRDAVHGIYREVVAVEQALRDGGASAVDTAAAGAAELGRLVAAAGLGSYDDLVRTALPAEAVARAAASPAPVRTEGVGPLADVLDGALEVAQAFGETLTWLDELAVLVAALDVAAQDARAAATDLRTVTDLAREASGQVAGTAPVLARTSDAMGGLVGELVEGLLGLSAELGTAREAVLEQRFRIALARLHDDMVVVFAREVLDGDAPPDALRHVPALCRALCDDFDALTATTERALVSIRVASERAGEQLARFQTFLSTWRLQVPRYGVSRQLGEHVDPIDEHLQRGYDRITALRALAAQCQAGAGPVEIGGFVGPVWRILQAADQLRVPVAAEVLP